MRDKRVLVVDDDNAIRALLFTVLRRRGLEVDTARHGGEALERCAQCRYAMVLLDLMMPQLNGYEVLREFSALPPDERPLVLVLTAGAEPRDLDPAIVAGTVRKPFDIDVLVEMVVGCLQSLTTREQLPACPPADSADPSGKGSRRTH